MKSISIAKLNEGTLNEDAAIANEHLIAVSDGAGGGGVFAEKWSKYLVEHLPDEPISSYEEMDAWLDKIWEPFYLDCENIAMAKGGMFLNKFYDEGSFATLVALWNGTGQDCDYITYGDSVVFHYLKGEGVLIHSFGKLEAFNNPPFLINCKDPTDEIGFQHGTFRRYDNSVLFAASDALAHYIIMMYEVSKKDQFKDELQAAIDAKTKNSNFIQAAMNLKKIDFEKDVIDKLQNCRNWKNFTRHIESLRKRGLIAHDDYSLVIM